MTPNPTKVTTAAKMSNHKVNLVHKQMTIIRAKENPKAIKAASPNKW